jgi:cellulose synthase (UDP-forming)
MSSLSNSVSGLLERAPKATIALWCALGVGMLVLAGLPADLPAQTLLSVAGLGIVIAMVQRATDNPNDWRRAAILICGLFLSLRYMMWRSFNTLSLADAASMTAAYLLYIAEAYAFLIFALGIFVNFYPMRRPSLRLRPGDYVPTVDILVPSYNEAADLLEVTLRCCLAVRYPADKKRIYLLDDGGTAQKRNDPNPRKRQQAIDRHRELRELCDRLGVGYLTREKNEHAKAGNINAAFKRTDGELILILDADHVPTSDMLERTVPWFTRDPGVFLVQTPHFMINPDPIDRNLLSAFRRMPAENEMFYVTIQRGLDFWDSSFFCGSAAVLRRTSLELVGGLTGDSITEDAETALELHSRGFRSVYVDQPMVGGLAPESFTGFVVQRMRWAQGMTQIMLLKLPSALRKMHWYQAVSYINACLFWMFPLARLIFLLSPCAYLYFGLKIYSASVEQILVYAIPHIVGAQICNAVLFGRTRWPLISELYELMQSIYSMMAIIQVFRNPRQPQFVVTPKSEVVEEEFVSPLVRPFYFLFFFVMLAMVAGALRFAYIPGSRPLTVVVMFWNMVNLTLISAAFGALLERRQRRSAPRMPLQLPADLEAPDGQRIKCSIEDISAGGFRLSLGQDGRKLRFGDQSFLHVWIPSVREEWTFKIEIRSSFAMGRERGLGCRFTELSAQDRDMMYALMYGDSESWSQFIARRTRPMPFFRAVALVFTLSYRPIVDHFTHLYQRRRGNIAG